MQPFIIGGLGAPELLIILAVVMLLFGATKLPELARGSGRALRIFKAETKGLMDDDDEDPGPVATPGPVTRPANLPVTDAVAAAARPIVEPTAEPRQR
jgi:sec-independent protein translocase protein TatA